MAVHEDDDELSTLSFGALKRAEQIMERDDQRERTDHKKKTQGHKKKTQGHCEESSSESEDEAFFEEDERDDSHRHKHAPREHSSKRRVRRVREIPGLPSTPRVRTSSGPGGGGSGGGLYEDIRFSKATGGVEDEAVVRRRYAFLDEYRASEISELEQLLRDPRRRGLLSEGDVSAAEEQLRSMKSRLQSVQNRDLEQKIVREYEGEMNKGNRTRFHLKKSERRKVVQKWKYEHMGAKQRERAMARKRKKQLGREFRELEGTPATSRQPKSHKYSPRTK
ncbi:rRNA-processing protein RRP36 KNAG_0G02980 [Huiozyma naganishii CBS 8797]|uniref:rRNA biogenesis protein RRP36 n=1 Tax=Huiozyma naganishii (strain ATCC MYA-139 / BCRC 22969 / CBS 8797 / KCTC 17520 / NBRC 10181 / NCYC 3082 / Yp74L-3) TaxID=1071383 RepID=J7R907_HUIN7|nr:hypothetical protein KNAG_0G02980 [Kazachstania naganishii CBS 8797]CCK71355.1 hypothetical protein KNAG_0G02980 [Kazachstania naganishii CBS 8797]